MKVDGVIKDLESLVRYVTPGFTLLAIGLCAGYNFSGEFNSAYILIAVPFLGIAWYSLHRTVLNLLDYPIYWATRHDIGLSYRQNLAPGSKETRSYLYTRLANIHLAMVIAEQSLAVSFVARENAAFLLWFGLVAIAVSLASYVVTLHEICKYDEYQSASQKGAQPGTPSTERRHT